MRRDPDSGALKVTALDASELHSKTTEAQMAAFKESLNQETELLRDVGIIDDVSPTILAFQPTSLMNDSAATARTAARLPPLCVIHHAMCHHLHIRGGEGGHRCCAARAHEHHNAEAV